ncbi:MAG: acyltransferase family protein, partial [Bdellovibrionota bacterium]
FFMISGFYIYLLLKTKYVGRTSLKAFYQNRFLRLFPSYWMVLAFTSVISLLGWTAVPSGSFFFYWSQWWSPLPWDTLFFAIATNVGIFFQDWAMFLTADPATGHLVWSSNFLRETHPMWLLLMVPQAWSLGTELTFYLLAPWLFKHGTKLLAGIAAGSLALRLVLLSYGMDADPWTARFFPTELLFFCVGGLAAHYYLTRLSQKSLTPAMGKGVFAAVIALTVLFQFNPLFTELGPTPWAYYGAVALALPFLFKFTKEMRWDRRLGELSYPVYIGHFVMMRMVAHPQSEADSWSANVVFWSLVFGAILLHAAKPFERMRTKNSEALGREKKSLRSKTPARAA